MLWYTPDSESPLQESSLLKLYNKNYNSSDDLEDWANFDSNLQQPRLDSFSESVISYGSSSQMDSTRLSCSTLGSSGLHTGSECSAATSPLGYGFALGSPMRDEHPQEEKASQSSHRVGPVSIGLAMANDLPATAVATNGSFSHHRRPSWTLQNIMAKTNSDEPAAPAPTRALEVQSSMPTWPVTIPPRGTSQSRSSSSASNKLRLGKSSIPSEEDRPLPTRSASSHSMSSTADSSFSHASSSISPRSSSMRKSKGRPKLTSKASEPILLTLGPLPSTAVATRTKAGSVSEAHHHRNWNDYTMRNRALTGGSSNTMRDIRDYLAYTAENASDILPASPVKSKVTAVDESILLFADDITLDELEKQAGPKTTHLLLSNCKNSSLTDFLNRILPIVGPNLLVLDLSKTSLMHLPDSVIHCTNLEELNISNVAFSRPWKCHALSGLSTLRVLHADSCGFAVIPPEIAQLQMLRTLSLQHNSLSHLPSWMYRLILLRRLYLEGNPFQGPWQQVCEAFTSVSQQTSSAETSPVSTRPQMERAPDSAPSKMPNYNEIEEYEEIADEALPATAPIMQSIKRKEDKRPLMRRMMTTGNEAAALSSPIEDSALGISDMSLSSKGRRPSQGADKDEKKWGTLIRKLGRKPSNPQLPFSAPSSVLSSPIKSRSISLHQPTVTKATQPLTPVGWQEHSGDSSWSSSLSKRGSYLAASQTGPEAVQQRRVHALLQYLKDLDDLSALRLGPPGTTLPMDRSMASTYSSPSKDVAPMDRSGSETSRESMHSTSTASSASQNRSDQSHPSGSIPSTFASTQSMKDDAQRRIHILQEIVATEETYIRGLQELVDIYVVPSSAIESSSGQSVVSPSDRRKVFANVEAIFHFHQSAFLPALREVTKSIIDVSEDELERQRADPEAYNAMSASITEQVAGVFSKHAAYLRMYSAYVNNVDAAQKRVGQWKVKTSENNTPHGIAAAAATITAEGSSSPNLSPKERKRIKVYLQKAKMDPRHSQLSLETYLHLPVQRIPRYRLLFEDLNRSCPSRRLQDPAAIARALDAISSLATQMNESKRQSENDRKLLEWQARIQGKFASPLLQPHRRLVRDGELTLKRVVMRITAFHMAKSQWTDEECLQTTQCDGAVTDTDLGIVQVECLDQASMSKSVHVLLCNDITVVVVKDDSASGSNSAVDLFAVLRIQGSIELVGQTSELPFPIFKM
jgi:Leucine-rich repeat (LRR) protein